MKASYSILYGKRENNQRLAFAFEVPSDQLLGLRDTCYACIPRRSRDWIKECKELVIMKQKKRIWV